MIINLPAEIIENVTNKIIANIMPEKKVWIFQ